MSEKASCGVSFESVRITDLDFAEALESLSEKAERLVLLLDKVQGPGVPLQPGCDH